MKTTDFKIDFGSVSKFRNKITQREIDALNKIFEDEEIKKKILLSETERKYRNVIFVVGNTVLFLILYYLYKHIYVAKEVLESIFRTLSVITIFNVGLKKYSKSIVDGLKRRIIPEMLKVMHKDLVYNRKFSFVGDINFLYKVGFISYKDIKKMEDSIRFEYDQNGKNFSIDGLEIFHKEDNESFLGFILNFFGFILKLIGFNNSNYYLLKANFPNARIPMESPLFLKKQTLKNIILNLFKSHKKVNMENLEFEHYYDVYCEDQIASRMILTPSFMERIVKFREKTGKTYEFLFTENNLYLKRDIYMNFLEFSTHKNLKANLGTYLDFYLNLRGIMYFIYEMNLMYLSKTTIK